MNCDILVVHPHKHHLLDFAVGAFRRYPHSFYVTPFYRKGLGALVGRFPGVQGAKARGYWHPQLSSNQVISPLQWQIKKLQSHISAEGIIGAFDDWVADKIQRREWCARVVVTVQDYLPNTSLAAKQAGSLLISDQIINQSNDAMERIVRHGKTYGIEIPEHSETINNAILQLADHITAPSRYVAHGLANRFPVEAKLHVIPYCTDTLRFSRPENAERSIGPIRIVARANSVRKGGHLLLHALRKVGSIISRKSADRGITIQFLGEIESALIPLFNDVQHELKGVLNISARNYAHAEVPTLLANASLFVMPSLSEGMSLIAMEAANCELPMIISEYCGIDWFVSGLHGVEIDDSLKSIEQALLIAFDSRDKWSIWGKASQMLASIYTRNNYQIEIERLISNACR